MGNSYKIVYLKREGRRLSESLGVDGGRYYILCVGRMLQ